MQERDANRSDPATASLTPGERELEVALGSLRLAPAGVDPARALFDAGVAVGRRRTRAWQAMTGALAVALAAAVLLRMPRANGGGGDGISIAPGAIAQVEEKIAPHSRQASVTASPVVPVSLATRTSAGSNEYVLPPLPMPGERPGYLQLRDQVLQGGPEALRPANAAAPLWMADPAARRVVRPLTVLRG